MYEFTTLTAAADAVPAAVAAAIEPAAPAAPGPAASGAAADFGIHQLHEFVLQVGVLVERREETVESLLSVAQDVVVLLPLSVGVLQDVDAAVHNQSPANLDPGPLVEAQVVEDERAPVDDLPDVEVPLHRLDDGHDDALDVLGHSAPEGAVGPEARHEQLLEDHLLGSRFL
eukprot:CAMPEP_0182509550 /NCGR_PEP_ID=MMETSP1321-20130603/27041_1 /TAXON_ID=91990 /ORGANISM="Bolidomonas sp., Strain RCC1657" /LENGTH=171 /DNA_ID=CAMNT_0024715853 /DNA_START=149 /DNA_END=662 /DNA_ORIENTATION=-